MWRGYKAGLGRGLQEGLKRSLAEGLERGLKQGFRRGLYSEYSTGHCTVLMKLAVLCYPFSFHTHTHIHTCMHTTKTYIYAHAHTHMHTHSKYLDLLLYSCRSSRTPLRSRLFHMPTLPKLRNLPLTHYPHSTSFLPSKFKYNCILSQAHRLLRRCTSKRSFTYNLGRAIYPLSSRSHPLMRFLQPSDAASPHSKVANVLCVLKCPRLLPLLGIGMLYSNGRWPGNYFAFIHWLDGFFLVDHLAPDG
jgi:hypothetical protein